MEQEMSLLELIFLEAHMNSSDLVYGELCLDLHVHGHKEWEEEEDPAGESQQLAGGELRVWTNLGEGVSALLEGEDGDHGADDHDEDGEEEYHVEDWVPAGDARHSPVTDLREVLFMEWNDKIIPWLEGGWSIISSLEESKVLTTNFFCLIYWYWQSSHTGGSPVFFEQTSSHFCKHRSLDMNQASPPTYR